MTFVAPVFHQLQYVALCPTLTSFVQIHQFHPQLPLSLCQFWSLSCFWLFRLVCTKIRVSFVPFPSWSSCFSSSPRFPFSATPPWIQHFFEDGQCWPFSGRTKNQKTYFDFALEFFLLFLSLLSFFFLSSLRVLESFEMLIHVVSLLSSGQLLKLKSKMSVSLSIISFLLGNYDGSRLSISMLSS